MIETHLSRVVKAPVTVVGCGRTDSHVHASQYFFHTDLAVQSTDDLLFRINKNLPDDIAVFDILSMPDNHHARLSTIERTYSYFIHQTKDPFLNSLSALYQYKLDLHKMKEAALLLTAYPDYRFFHRTASNPKTTLCHVTQTNLFVDETGDRIKFTISANRFLSGMVRIIVHKLLQVGRKKLTVDQFESYLRGSEIPVNIKSAYPQGLYLSKVTYPFLDVPSRSTFDHSVNGGRWKKI